MKNADQIARFSKHVRALREARGLSQQQLADLADIGKKTLQRVEQGAMNPSLDILISISKGLSIELKKLCDF